VFENRVLKRGRIWWETGENWHNGELHNLYDSPNISRMKKSSRMRWAGHIACMEAIRNADTFIGEPEGKKSRGRPRSRWKDDIRIDVWKIG
jgi:hypothetical protein